MSIDDQMKARAKLFADYVETDKPNFDAAREAAVRGFDDVNADEILDEIQDAEDMHLSNDPLAMESDTYGKDLHGYRQWANEQKAAKKKPAAKKAAKKKPAAKKAAKKKPRITELNPDDVSKAPQYEFDMGDGETTKGELKTPAAKPKPAAKKKTAAKKTPVAKGDSADIKSVKKEAKADVGKDLYAKIGKTLAKKKYQALAPDGSPINLPGFTNGFSTQGEAAVHSSNYKTALASAGDDTTSLIKGFFDLTDDYTDIVSAEHTVSANDYNEFIGGDRANAKDFFSRVEKSIAASPVEGSRKQLAPARRGLSILLQKSAEKGLGDIQFRAWLELAMETAARPNELNGTTRADLERLLDPAGDSRFSVKGAKKASLGLRDIPVLNENTKDVLRTYLETLPDDPDHKVFSPGSTSWNSRMRQLAIDVAQDDVLFAEWVDEAHHGDKSKAIRALAGLNSQSPRKIAVLHKVAMGLPEGVARSVLLGHFDDKNMYKYYLDAMRSLNVEDELAKAAIEAGSPEGPTMEAAKRAARASNVLDMETSDFVARGYSPVKAMMAEATQLRKAVIAKSGEFTAKTLAAFKNPGPASVKKTLDKLQAKALAAEADAPHTTPETKALFGDPMPGVTMDGSNKTPDLTKAADEIQGPLPEFVDHGPTTSSVLPEPKMPEPKTSPVKAVGKVLKAFNPLNLGLRSLVGTVALGTLVEEDNFADQALWAIDSMDVGYLSKYVVKGMSVPITAAMVALDSTALNPEEAVPAREYLHGLVRSSPEAVIQILTNVLDREIEDGVYEDEESLHTRLVDKYGMNYNDIQAHAKELVVRETGEEQGNGFSVKLTLGAVALLDVMRSELPNYIKDPEVQKAARKELRLAKASITQVLMTGPSVQPGERDIMQISYDFLDNLFTYSKEGDKKDTVGRWYDKNVLGEYGTRLADVATMLQGNMDKEAYGQFMIDMMDKTAALAMTGSEDVDALQFNEASTRDPDNYEVTSAPGTPDVGEAEPGYEDINLPGSGLNAAFSGPTVVEKTKPRDPVAVSLGKNGVTVLSPFMAHKVNNIHNTSNALWQIHGGPLSLGRAWSETDRKDLDINSFKGNTASFESSAIREYNKSHRAWLVELSKTDKELAESPTPTLVVTQAPPSPLTSEGEEEPSALIRMSSDSPEDLAETSAKDADKAIKAEKEVAELATVFGTSEDFTTDEAPYFGEGSPTTDLPIPRPNMGEDREGPAAASPDIETEEDGILSPGPSTLSKPDYGRRPDSVSAFEDIERKPYRGIRKTAAPARVNELLGITEEQRLGFMSEYAQDDAGEYSSEGGDKYSKIGRLAQGKRKMKIFGQEITVDSTDEEMTASSGGSQR
jgi:hypothetical protein